MLGPFHFTGMFHEACHSPPLNHVWARRNQKQSQASFRRVSLTHDDDLMAQDCSSWSMYTVRGVCASNLSRVSSKKKISCTWLEGKRRRRILDKQTRNKVILRPSWNKWNVTYFRTEEVLILNRWVVWCCSSVLFFFELKTWLSINQGPQSSNRAQEHTELVPGHEPIPSLLSLARLWVW